VSQQNSGEGVDVARQELDQLRERMAAVKEQAAAEVDEKWTSPIRTEDLFDIKVKQKLANNEEYQVLQTRIREAEAKLHAGGSAATGG
jgi:DNA invertase Pin-like site-specific DNA recombinase